MNIILNLILCHLLGDYVLQCAFIAETKGSNWYHLIVHCFLYCLPFYFMFGLTYQLLFILISHIIIDSMKARYNKINYKTDQILHYLILFIYLI